MALKPIKPSTLSSTNSNTEGIGLRMHQAETFMAAAFPVAAAVFTALGGGRSTAGDIRRDSLAPQPAVDHAHGVAITQEAGTRATTRASAASRPLR